MQSMIGRNLGKMIDRLGEGFQILPDIDIKGRSWTNRRTSRHWSMENIRMALFKPAPVFAGGDVIYDVGRDKYFFVYTYQPQLLAGNLVAQQAVLLLVNASCEVLRATITSGSMGGSSMAFNSLETEVKCHLTQVTGDLREERPGLDMQTDFLLYMQDSEDLKVLDRVVVGEDNYRVNIVNSVDFEGLYEVQLSKDKR